MSATLIGITPYASLKLTFFQLIREGFESIVGTKNSGITAKIDFRHIKHDVRGTSGMHGSDNYLSNRRDSPTPAGPDSY
jgi:hypothetical protein